MRIAVVGKGGTGKSVISGTLARVLARRGHKVLAMDVDTMPGLAFSLGLANQTGGILPEEMAEKQEKKGWKLKKGTRINTLVSKYSEVAADGVRYLQLGKLPDKLKPGSTMAFWYVLQRFKRNGWDMFADLAAGTRQPFSGWANSAEMLLLVIEPSAKSVLSVRRLAKLAQRPKRKRKKIPPEPPQVMLVANKLRSQDDLVLIQQGTKDLDLPIVAEIPFDSELAVGEQLGKALLDHRPNAAAVRTIEKLANFLVEKTSNGLVQNKGESK